MADIPLNLDISQYLAPTYTNHPRLAEHAVYDPVLRAFVIPEFEVAAAKARKAAKRAPGAGKGGKEGGKGKTKPAPEIVDDGVEKKFLCERAKSSMSRCRKCGQSILKDSLRFGYGSPDPRGEYGAIPIWFHVRCAPLSFVGFSEFDDTLASLCYGFFHLSDEERKEVSETGGKGASLLRGEDAEYANEFDEQQPVAERLVQRRGVSVPLLPKPAEVTGATLLPFQLEGYSWMMAQEANPATKGGILADEMGMGKTLQTISLIVSKKEMVRPTLVVCPVAAVMQWYSEIQKFTGPDTLAIHVYHGSQKIAADKLAEFDIVITTYQTLENEYRKQANLAKVMCKYCKRMFLPGKLGFHLKYMCGPNAMRTMKQSLREVKDRGAAETAKRTMGIGGSASADAPTVSNVLREVVRESGLLTEDQLAGMTQYDMMRLYRGASKEEADTSADSERKREASKEEYSSGGNEDKTEIKQETDESVRARLKKKTAAELKELLTSNGVTNFAKSTKKDDLVKMVIDAGLGGAGATSSSGKVRKSVGSARAKKPVAKLAATQPSSSGCSSRASSVTGRRSAATKAMAMMHDGGSDDSEESDDSPASESPVAKGRSRNKRKLNIIEQASESSSDSSSEDWSGPETSESSYASSDSSGETIDVFTDSEADSEPVRAVPKKRATAKARARRDPDNAHGQPQPKKARYDADAEAELDEQEDQVEDVDLSHSPLHCVKWGRLVLDEAHRIKQRTNSTSLAAFALAAEYRWCLSGTPLQNRVGELYSLVRFLRFSPFAHYFCKGCDCCSLHFRFVDNKYCVKCGCARTKHFSYFKQVISGPIVKYGVGDGSALKILKSQVLDTILLRRTKIERQADLNLPPISIEVKRNKLSDEERDFYESLYKQSMLKFDTFAKSGTLLHNYAHIFDLLTRLRQALDHPYLIVFGADYTVPVAVAITAGEEASAAPRGICALCQDDIGTDEPRADANCGHKFHADCVREYIREAPQLPSGGCGCPACFVPLTVVFEATDSQPDETPAGPTPSQPETPAGATPTPPVSPEQVSKEKLQSIAAPRGKQSVIMDRISASGFQSSTKIESLVEELAKLPADSKVLIFSQFTRMLDLVEFRVKQQGVGCAKLTGALNLAQRSNIILAFNTDPSLRALLISLKAGGEGLNLQAADHVFLIDPWWNPASELQAIQRAHRIGQTKPVRAVRFVTENSVEEKVVALQEMKQLVFDATVGQSQGAEKKLTESDLRFLFQH